MAILVSPGVDIQVIDESVYATSGPGTVPLVIIGTESYKALPSNGGIAAGTIPSNAGKLYLMTSQRELVQTFGEPKFYQSGGTPLHGYELNEYGLLAAYQYLGLANRAYIVRGDINMSELFPTPFEPRDEALTGTYWLDTSITEWGVFVSNGNSVPGLAWKNKKAIVIDTTSESETVVMGVQGYNTNTSVVIGTTGIYYLDINEQRITFSHSGVSTDDITLQDISDAINLATIPNITASVFRYAGLSWLLIKNKAADRITVNNTSTSSLLTLLGLNNAAEVVQPKVSLGQEGDVAVVTLNSDNLVFQKIIPRNRIGDPDPLASSGWFLIGSASWKAATPTFSQGTNTPTLTNISLSAITVGDQLIISDGTLSVTVTFGNLYGTSTVTDLKNEINAAINAIPAATRPPFYAETKSTSLVISNWAGGDIIFSEPTTNSSAGIIAQLGLGNRKGNRLFYSSHTQVPGGSVSGDVWVKTTTPNKGANNVVKIYNRATQVWSVLTAPYFTDDDAASIKLGVNIAAGNLYTQYNIYGDSGDPIASTLLKKYRGANDVSAVATKIPGLSTSSSSSSSITYSVTSASSFLTPGDKFVITAGQPNGIAVSAVVTIPGPETDDVVAAINALSGTLVGVTATTKNGFLVVSNTNKLTLTFTYLDPNTDTYVNATNVGDPLQQLGIGETTFSNWEPLVYEALSIEPTTVAAEGTLWYDVDFRTDIMISDGDEWKGYKNVYPSTDPFGAILAGSAPLEQRDGTPLVENDIWIDTTQLEDYPKMYRWRTVQQYWEPVDLTDQTTPFGVVFADARWNSTGKANGSRIAEDMLISDYCDPDAPDPRTYPAGMLLFNTRYSNYNVKVWRPNQFSEYVGQEVETGVQYHVGFKSFPSDTITAENKGAWVTASGNANDGSPYMGRKAQRQMIIRSLSSVIVANQDIRSESVFFNLIAAPGYVELLDEMVTLNVDKKEIAFIIADVPARLKPNATDIQNWATNTANATDNGDKALITRYTYSQVAYPWGLSRDLSGNEVFVPSSSIILRTYGYNDSVSFPWFAPAGFTRGIVTNASSVGYLTEEDEYQPVILNPGQRDVMYLNNINPIAYLVGRGLVVFGQKTLHPISSALDRVNVARLICFLRYNLDIIAKPFLFEPNDKQTRDQVKTTFDRYMDQFIGLRAVYDYYVQCDEGNNTPARIDRNELRIDLAVSPVKAVEFIYIPIRIRNTGEDLSTQNISSQ